jgi:phage terminase Nu1 subunit (DNA packaging protein)
MTPDDKPLPQILNKADLADLLDKSVRTVERLHRAGKLPEQLVRGRWASAVIKRWLDGGTVRRGRR